LLSSNGIPNPLAQKRKTVRDVLAHLFAMSPVQTPLWEKVDRRAAPRRLRGAGRIEAAAISRKLPSWNTPHPSPSATPSPTRGEGRTALNLLMAANPDGSHRHGSGQ
ncbi:hypothetical protein NKI59_31845, partial [Mesorhizobium sp. M0598]|uniref:hypothetical protein n=1 Tax=Mesorhizobium sp. M0598 TaxID=2956968 RepID=UPI00333BC9F6